MDILLYTEGHENSRRTPFFVDIPGSKSESARYLVLNFLNEYQTTILNLSPCDDIWAMRRALNQMLYGGMVNVGESGTAYRFLTALAAATPGFDGLICGSQRLMERPIAPLVEALSELGGLLRYDPGEDLRIFGLELRGGKITINPSISSQFISALMLIGPKCLNGLTINFEADKKPVSEPYINLTAALMGEYGVEVTRTPSSIHIPRKDYFSPKRVFVRGDWTSSSYLLCAYILENLNRNPKEEMVLLGLTDDSGQNDIQVYDFLKEYGLNKRFYNNQDEFGLQFSLDEPTFDPRSVVEIDFSDCPDLFPTMAVFYAIMGRKYRMTGVRNLRIKESDRLDAVAEGLLNCGYIVKYDDDSFVWDGEMCETPEVLAVDPHGDHRIIMAFSLFGLRRQIWILHAEHVCKSFPNYFRALNIICPNLMY